MWKITRLLPLAAVLTAGVCLLAAARSPDDDEEKAKIEAARKAADDVTKLADNVDKPDDLKKQADAVAKKYDEMEPIMRQMKPVEKGGMQIGKPNFFPNDSIELGLLDRAKNPPSAKDIKAQAKDLQRAADVVRGIAEVAPSYGSKWAKDANEQKLWQGYADDMKKSSDDLRSAIQAGDAAGFKKAINKLNRSCNDCHTKFRDAN